MNKRDPPAADAPKSVADAYRAFLADAAKQGIQTISLKKYLDYLGMGPARTIRLGKGRPGR